MDNLALQHHLLDLVDEGGTVITESDRLAHQLLWRYRLRQVALGRSAWRTARVASINQWLIQFWNGLWPEERPASSFMRWRLLRTCLDALPPPEPLSADIPLVLAIDESFDHCLRYGIDPGSGLPGSPLVEWRRAIWRTFNQELQCLGRFHPAGLAERVFTELTRNPMLLADPVAAVGFEFAGYWEKRLFQGLEAHRAIRCIPLPLSRAEPEALAFADPEQELYALLEDLAASARRFPLHEIAVVVLDPGRYCSLLAKGLEDLFGPPLLGDDAAYNLFPNRSLAEQSLFQAAFLPLEFVGGGQTRLDLLRLLRSPYYGLLAPYSRALSQWDWTWREQGVEEDLKALWAAASVAGRGMPAEEVDALREVLSMLVERRRREVAEWVQALIDLWQRLSFPVLANELDQIAWQRLGELMERLGADFGNETLTGAEFSAWVRAAAERIIIQRTGYEEAGIQVIGGLEARGLAFGRLTVPGMLAGVLPQPARPLPFLSPQERKQVQGGSAESQFAFGSHLFGQLQAVAGELVLTRPMMDRKGEPCLPSPFWPADREQRVRPVVPWRHDLPALQRARWVREGLQGVRRTVSVEPLQREGEPPNGDRQCAGAGGRGPVPWCFAPHLRLPEEISVSSLEGVLTCSSRFFFQDILRLQPLPERSRGLDPQRRGQLIHEILALFGRRIVRWEFAGTPPLNSLLDMLKDVVRERLGPYGAVLFWDVEEKRLIGTDGGEVRGVLTEWLEEEWGRFQDGWRWESSEAAFSKLSLKGCPISLKGRLDRVDVHPELGVVCWDYKTGAIPSAKEVREALSSPQLPAYLLALRKGAVKVVSGEATAISAGYIDLRSIKYLKHALHLPDSEEMEALLDRFETLAGSALNDLTAGKLSPRWMETPCDPPCAYRCLCGLPLAELPFEPVAAGP